MTSKKTKRKTSQCLFLLLLDQQQGRRLVLPQDLQLVLLQGTCPLFVRHCSWLIVFSPFYRPTSRPSQKPTQPPKKSSKSGLTGGAIAGIVIGSLAGVAIGIAGYLYFKNVKEANGRKPLSTFEKDEEEEDEIPL